MIFILHGEDSKSSYVKKNELLKNFSDHRIVNQAGKETTIDQFKEILQSQNLFEEKEVIVGHNLIKNKIVDAKSVKAYVTSREIVLWEEGELTNSQISKFKGIAKIEIFKLPTQLFVFLDSIVPYSKQPFILLQKLKNESQDNLVWMLLNRFFLLNLAKRGIDHFEASELTSKITNQRLQDWQWQKIKNQAYPFDANTLKSLFSGILKIDYMLKNGSTNLDSYALISMLFVKYLKPRRNATINTTVHGRYSMV